MIYDRLSEISRTDNHHFILLVKTEYRADLFIKALNAVSVSLLSEFSEIV